MGTTSNSGSALPETQRFMNTLMELLSKSQPRKLLASYQTRFGDIDAFQLQEIIILCMVTYQKFGVGINNLSTRMKSKYCYIIAGARFKILISLKSVVMSTDFPGPRSFFHNTCGCIADSLDSVQLGHYKSHGVLQEQLRYQNCVNHLTKTTKIFGGLVSQCQVRGWTR